MDNQRFDQEWLEREPLYARAMRRMQSFLEDVVPDINKEYKSRAHVAQPRLKSKKDTLDKATQRGFAKEEIFKRILDIAGTRIICDNLQDIYTLVHGLMKAIQATKEFRLIKLDDKVVISSERGYRAYHLDTKVRCIYQFHSQWVPCEVQIQTLAQNMWATLSHADVYKHQDIPPWQVEEMQSISDILFMADITANYLRAQITRCYPGEFKDAILNTDIDIGYLEKTLKTWMNDFWLQIHVDNLRKCGIKSKQELDDIVKDETKLDTTDKWFESGQWEKKFRHGIIFSEQVYFAIVASKQDEQKAKKLLEDYFQTLERLRNVSLKFDWTRGYILRGR